MKTPVVLRIWKTGIGVLALFPTLPSDQYGHCCSSFESVGQHGSADYSRCIQKTRPATRAESESLIQELNQCGYDLQIIKRATAAMHAKRKEISL